MHVATINWTLACRMLCCNLICNCVTCRAEATALTNAVNHQLAQQSGDHCHGHRSQACHSCMQGVKVQPLYQCSDDYASSLTSRSEGLQTFVFPQQVENDFDDMAQGRCAWAAIEQHADQAPDTEPLPHTWHLHKVRPAVFPDHNERPRVGGRLPAVLVHQHPALLQRLIRLQHWTPSLAGTLVFEGRHMCIVTLSVLFQLSGICSCSNLLRLKTKLNHMLILLLCHAMWQPEVRICNQQVPLSAIAAVRSLQ